MADTVNGWTLPQDLHQLAFGGDQAELAGIICRLDGLRDAMTEGDLAAIVAHARAIKASAIRLEAASLVATCRHLELDAAHHVTENLERLFQEAEVELKALRNTNHKENPLTNAAGSE